MSRAWQTFGLGALALALAAGCGDRPAPGQIGWEIALRLVPDDPAGTFERERLYDRVRVFDWSLASEDDLEPWRLNNFERPLRWVDGGLVVERDTRPPELVRGVRLDAMSVDAVEVDVGGLLRGPLRWFWTREGENFVAERGLWLKGDEEAGTETTTQLLEVGRHPEWSGRIRRLRLDPTIAEGESVRVEAVRGIRYRPPEGFLDAAVRLGWKVDLGHELRNALLAPPGKPIERRFEVPEHARLRFAYGVEGRAAGATRFEVVAQPPGGEPVRLFSAAGEPGRWHEATCDLSALAGQEITLRLETSITGASAASTAMPVWANPEVLRPATTPPRPNVVVISVDTLRPDHLPMYGYARDTSPRLAAWARESAVVFEDAVAAAPWTLPSHVSMLSGLDADRHGVNHRLPMPADLRSLPEVLREAGYRTLAITGGGWMHPRFGFGQGFDRYHYWPPKTEKDDELVDGVTRAVEWLELLASEPFFLFLHTFETHSPHRRREPFYSALGGAAGEGDAEAVVTERSSAPAASGYLLSKKFFWHRKGAGLSAVAPSEQQEIVDRYDSGIAHADSQLGRLLERLDEMVLAAGTLVIVTSDHGEAFGEKGLDSHGYLYDFNLLVPLIVALPEGRGAGTRVSRQVRSVDLMPTVLDVAGLPVPPGVDGRSLLPLVSGEESEDREAWSYASSSNRGLALRRSGRMKYILNNTAWPPLRGREELYDLSTDPAELDDLAAGADHLAGIRAQALARLERLAQGIEIRIRNGESAPLRGLLRSLAVRGFQLKTLDVEGAALSWDETRSGEATFEVPPGGHAAFLLESALPAELEVVLDLAPDAPGASYRGRIEARLEEPWQVRYDASGWRTPRQVDPQARTSVTVVRRGSAPASTVADPAAVDPQLRAQLEALGYLD